MLLKCVNVIFTWCSSFRRELFSRAERKWRQKLFNKCVNRMSQCTDTRGLDCTSTVSLTLVLVYKSAIAMSHTERQIKSVSNNFKIEDDEHNYHEEHQERKLLPSRCRSIRTNISRRQGHSIPVSIEWSTVCHHDGQAGSSCSVPTRVLLSEEDDFAQW
jgi:hypothetical protein